MGRKHINMPQIAELLNGISERFDWDKVMEGDYIIGLMQGKQNISLEPGGQFELSGAPLETLYQTCAEVNSHLYQGRYEIMRNYMPQVGSLGLDMMVRTCTVQIAIALFVNSPFTEGKPNGLLSMRSHIWTDTDKNRTGMLPFVFDDSFR